MSEIERKEPVGEAVGLSQTKPSTPQPAQEKFSVSFAEAFLPTTATTANNAGT